VGRHGKAGWVAASSALSQAIAWARPLPHISADGRNEAQTAGRDGCPKSLQRSAASSCGHGTPAGLTPRPEPDRLGIGELIDGAVQQAPQCGRHSIGRIIGVGAFRGSAVPGLRPTRA
jgi:hypothetical protein